MRNAILAALTGLAVLSAGEAPAQPAAEAGGHVEGGAQSPTGQLRLDWDDNSADEAGFIIERRTSPEDPFREVARTGANVNAFDDVTVQAGTSYCYRVVAFSEASLSSPSNEACASARPFASVPVVKLDLFSVPPGRGMILTATLTPGALPIAVDAYIVVVLPDGAVISIGEDRGAVLGLRPMMSGALSTPSTGEILRYTFTGGEPTGSYRWYGAVTEAGTLTVVGDISAQTFEFAP
jgi:hypothetical protein